MKRRYQKAFIEKLCLAIEKLCKARRISSLDQIETSENILYIVNNKKVYKNFKILKYLKNILDVKVINLGENTAEWYKIL